MRWRLVFGPRQKRHLGTLTGTPAVWEIAAWYTGRWPWGKVSREKRGSTGLLGEVREGQACPVQPGKARADPPPPWPKDAAVGTVVCGASLSPCYPPSGDSHRNRHPVRDGPQPQEHSATSPAQPDTGPPGTASSEHEEYGHSHGLPSPSSAAISILPQPFLQVLWALRASLPCPEPSVVPCRPQTWGMADSFRVLPTQLATWQGPVRAGWGASSLQRSQQRCGGLTGSPSGPRAEMSDRVPSQLSHVGTLSVPPPRVTHTFPPT